MPLIATIKCDTCDLHLPAGAGGYMYVLDAKGERIPCPHPGELRTIERITGFDWHGRKNERPSRPHELLSLLCVYLSI